MKQSNLSLPRSYESGAVLATTLVFLMVLTMVAVIAMQSTVTDQKISTNVGFKTKSFEYSEAPRSKAGDVMDAHVFWRGWSHVLVGSTTTAIKYADLSVVDRSSELYLKNNTGEDMLNPSSLTKDMTYSRSTGSGGESMTSDIYVFRNGVKALPGHSAAMVAGYEGQGKGLAGSGAAIFFDIHSRGRAAGHAATTTSADVRVMIRN